jgi:extracellular elastinolytic metalloproteinase
MYSRRVRRRSGVSSRAALTIALAIATGLVATTAAAAPRHTGAVLADRDARSGAVVRSAEQRAIVERLGAAAQWNRFGTPSSLVKFRGTLARGVAGDTAVQVARNFARSNAALFRLEPQNVAGLELLRDSKLGGAAHAVSLRQRFGGLPAAEGGLLTIAVKDDDVVYVSSSLTGDTTLAAQPRLSAADAWLLAARDVGHGRSLVNVQATRTSGDWTLIAVAGLADPQRARLVAVPTPNRGVRPAYETLFLDNTAGHTRAYTHFVDAATGEILIRRDIVEHSHPAAATFAGTVPPTDGACAPDNGPWTVAAGETVGSVAVAVEATLTTNDSVIHLLRDGRTVASQDTATSPEALAYDPPDSGVGTYEVRVCDFSDGAGWDAPATFSGQIAFNPQSVDGDFPYPPKWKVFPSWPPLGGASSDTRELWCWDSTVGQPPRTLAECTREVQNSASRAPWDYSFRTNAPTFTTMGNNAVSAEAWGSPLTPGPTGHRPVSLQRDYSFPWTNAWFTSDCFTPFVPGQSHDISAAVTNLFVMHNRMHDWSYHLGFTEQHWNAQDSNLGNGGPGTADRDPLLGNAQAGAANGGFPSYLGRDNANMVSLPEGVPPTSNMYLWQPIAASFYAPCVDGDYDMAVIGHEFGHLIENRMIGKGGTRGGHHAGAMGESSGDLLAVEYLNEYGFVSGTSGFAVGPYVTGNAERAIRNYNMSWPRTGGLPESGSSPKIDPLNFSNMGYDLTGPQVHADGEIWSATNHDIRQALVEKYNATAAAPNGALQTECAEGKRPVDQCPGNRRWIQLMFDAYLLMPTAPSMLDARNAYLAADQSRFGGANQTELWQAFARRGFGEGAASSNTASDTDVDPVPDFSSPRHDEANVTFAVTGIDKKPIAARIFVGHYEGRSSPIADTDPATSGPNLDETAGFVPGTYELVIRAAGYGHLRLSRNLAAGARTLTIAMRPNWASSSQGATASGDGTRHGALIDDAEATNWERTGAQPNVRGSQVTVDLGGSVHTVDRVQVSAMLQPGQSRFTALRQFQIQTCLADATNANCTAPSGWTTQLTSAENAFPGAPPRPVAPELLLRSLDLPSAVKASHVRIVVLTNQCTGNTAFQGEQDADPLNGTDCREGSPGAGTVEIFGDLPQVVAPRDNEVRIAELQVFSR